MKYFLRVCIPSLILSSCGMSLDSLTLSEDTQLTYLDGAIPSTEVKLAKIDLEDSPLVPTKCCFVDSFLVVCSDSREEEGLFRVYEKGRLVCKFGRVGNGPEDFNFHTLVSAGHSEKGSFKVGSSNYIDNVSVDDAGRTVTRSNRTPVPPALNHYDFAVVDDDTLLLVSRFSDSQFLSYDKRNKKVAYINYFKRPTELADFADFACARQLFDGTASATDEHIVVAYRHLKQIDVVSRKSGDILHLAFHGYNANKILFDEKKENIRIEDNAIEYFQAVSAVSDCFYVLCWDAPANKVRSGSVCSSLYKISYDGKALHRYDFDQPVGAFCVNNGTIYCIAIDKDENDPFVYSGNL